MANRFLNNITINDAYTLPSSDGTAGQIISTDGNGVLTFVDAAAGGSGESVRVACKNTSGSTITKGTPVYITGTVGSSFIIEIAAADASNASKMPAVGLLETDLANNIEGYVVTGGVLKNLTTDPIDSATPSSNDTIYVKAGGGLTLTKPSGTNYIQNVGKVGRVNSSSAGSIIVSSIMRTNDVPAPLFVDVANQKVGIGDSTPSVSLDINATDAVQMPAGTTAQRPTGVNGMFRYNSTTNQFEGFANSAWGAIAGSGGGSSSGATLSIERDVFTATANQTAFVISSNISSSSNTQVYIDGVYQAKSNYTTSGSTVTFSTGVPAGAIVEIIHFISVYAKVYTDTFTGDNTTVNFTASKDVTDENVTQVYIDGVYQSKDNYTTSGTTITFSTAPPNGSAVEVVHFEEISYSAIASNQFTGNGSQTNFTLTQDVDVNKAFVFIQGIYQEKSTYSISGTTLTFTTAPQNGYTIEVITIGAVSLVGDATYVDTFTGNGSTTNYTLSSTPASVNAIDVYLNGIYQNKSNFSVSGSTLIFSTAPTNNTAIEVKSSGAYIAADVTLTAGTGISITKNSINNFTISNTLIDTTVSYNTPTGGGFTYTAPSSSTGQVGSIYGPQTFTVTDGINVLSGTASISGLPNGLTVDNQSYNNSNSGNILTITLGGVFPSANSLNTNLVISGLTSTAPSLVADYLVVAGGGSGGGNYGGGGGAGGLRTSYGSATGGGESAESSLSLSSATNYTVTVGSGGAAANPANVNGSNGSDSVFDTITSIGGGGGGGSTTGNTGGSGGGAKYNTSAGSGTANQGYGGGTGAGGSPYTQGGGGGAGAVGGNYGSVNSGDGGVGISVSITGSAVYYAGGGGGGGASDTGGSGGSGGNGGGGTGGTTNYHGGANVQATSGTSNTGGGGGGAGGQVGSPALGSGAGGSGVVIIRYPNAYAVSIGAGLTGSTATDGSYKVTTFTAGTGTISFS